MTKTLPGTEAYDHDTLDNTLLFETQQAYDTSALELPKYDGRLSNFPQTIEIVLKIDRGKTFVFRQGSQIRIGRSSRLNSSSLEVDLALQNGRALGVSRLHASIIYYQHKFHVIDHNSTNGTKLNGKQLQANVMYQIEEGDIINFGLCCLKVDEINGISRINSTIHHTNHTSNE